MNLWSELTELMEYLENAQQCTWKCPFCGTQCGGIGVSFFHRNNQKIFITRHSGPHQCPIHASQSLVIKQCLITKNKEK
jgi:hypothetical protein